MIAGRSVGIRLLLPSDAVLVMATRPVLVNSIVAAGWLLPVLLSPTCCKVEPVVGPEELVDAAGICRVGMEDAVTNAKEGAGAR